MLAVSTHTYFPYSNPKIITTERQFTDVFVPCQAFKGKCFSLKMGYTGHQFLKRSANKAIQAVLSGVNDIEVSSSSSSVEEFTITASSHDKDDELKINVEVSGTKTQEIYDEVFSKMVDDAQPIPGFRRVKGGKTPNIPKEILLEILGPSKVYEQVIRKVIDSSIAEYVAKEGLTVGKDLQIEQSLEDLEAGFEPGGKFRFDAIVQCQDLK
ncbi:hypothetical protein Pfo_016489 [Paulownia fortunei]|nr:hypothetical protein Pfo_016489 [Paulownia fortunei]